MNSVNFASSKKVIGALFGSPAFHIFFIVVAAVKEGYFINQTSTGEACEDRLLYITRV